MIELEYKFKKDYYHKYLEQSESLCFPKNSGSNYLPSDTDKIQKKKNDLLSLTSTYLVNYKLNVLQSPGMKFLQTIKKKKKKTRNSIHSVLAAEKNI